MLSVPKESFPASDTLISLPSVCLLSIGMAALQGYNYNDIKRYETLTKYNSLYMCVCVYATQLLKTQMILSPVHVYWDWEVLAFWMISVCHFNLFAQKDYLHSQCMSFSEAMPL